MPQRVLFVGSKPLGLRILQELHDLLGESLVGALSFDDSSDARSALPEFREFCQKVGLDLRLAKSRRDSERLMAEFEPELCVVAGWYWLISDELLQAAPLGFIGLHNSLLPAYRGSSPLVWAILNGEEEVGVSLFSLVSGMDEGEIWAQGRVAVAEDTQVGLVLKQLEDESVRLIRDSVLGILDGSLKPHPQPETGDSYCAIRTPEDGRINWTWSARRIHDFIRAQSDPYPGAFTTLEGNRLTIWKARVFDRPYLGAPGQVAQLKPEGVFVTCGDGRAVILEEVELDAGRQAAGDVLTSIRTRLE